MGLDSQSGTRTDAPRPKPKQWHPTQDSTNHGQSDSTKKDDRATNSTDPGRTSAEAVFGPSTDWTKPKPNEPDYLYFGTDPMNPGTGNPGNPGNLENADNPDNPNSPKAKKRSSDAAAEAAMGGTAAAEAATHDGTASNLIRGMASAIGKAADFSSWMKPSTHGSAGDSSTTRGDGNRDDGNRRDGNRGDGTGRGEVTQQGDGAVKLDGTPETPVDAATKARNDHAAAGKEHADTQEKRYINRHNGKGIDAKHEPGEHKNDDGSSYTVGKDGHISSFTTAKTKDNPNGLTYSNIKYDEQGVKSYDSPWGQKYSRISDTNSQGYAHWKSTTQDGRPVVYQGSHTSQWVGKPSFSEDGFSNIIGSGPNNGMMFGRAMDGSHITTRQLRGGSIQTDTVLPDNTTVTRTSKVENGNLTPDDSRIRVKDSAGDVATVDLGAKGSTEPGNKPGHGATDAPKSEARNDSSSSETENQRAEKEKQREAEREQQRQKDEAAKAKEAKEKEAKDDKFKEKLAVIGKLMTPQNLQKLDQIQDAHIRTTPGNDHAIGVSLSLAQPMKMTAPDITVPNPDGPGFGKPKHTYVQHVSAVVSANPNDSDQLDVSQIGGVPSAAAAFGPLGRRRPNRDKYGHTQSMSFDDNHLTVKASTSRLPVTIAAHSFDSSSPTSALVGDADLRRTVGDGVEAVAKNLDELKIHKNAPGDFNITVDPKATEIPLNMKLEGKFAGLFGAEATKLQLKDGPIEMNLRTNNGSPELSFKEGDVQLGVKGLGIETNLSIHTISQGKDANGKPVARVLFYNSDKPFEIPIGN